MKVQALCFQLDQKARTKYKLFILEKNLWF